MTNGPVAKQAFQCLAQGGGGDVAQAALAGEERAEPLVEAGEQLVVPQRRDCGVVPCGESSPSAKLLRRLRLRPEAVAA